MTSIESSLASIWRREIDKYRREHPNETLTVMGWLDKDSPLYEGQEGIMVHIENQAQETSRRFLLSLNFARPDKGFLAHSWPAWNRGNP